MIQIRPIIPTDTDSYLAAYEAIAAEGIWIGGESPVAEDKRDRIRRSALEPSPDSHTVVAVDQANVVGWVHLELAHGRAEISLALLPDFRGQGIGRRFLDDGIDWARQRGAHKVDLLVWPHNTGAIALYERVGFVREGLRRRHWRRANGELWDSVEMSLMLDHTSPGSSL